ncbi:hypothetical protein N7492_001718 [Penicillium capsulatum]|uniref:Uncharacterized protein n=1 Tax=Penicillium capsulatum TaxID=69766 RepID=A0A9W9M1G3_9EURO|nr:hypothetical protein N7492_001718 [Penicillium capsulatum]KAJ6129231.1 hypothetical protein N7512_002011 [Penicillium capsulatum]
MNMMHHARDTGNMTPLTGGHESMKRMEKKFPTRSGVPRYSRGGSVQGTVSRACFHPPRPLKREDHLAGGIKLGAGACFGGFSPMHKGVKAQYALIRRIVGLEDPSPRVSV